MAEHDSLNSLFTDIANAIRKKTGGTNPIVANNFPEEILKITAGGSGAEFVEVVAHNKTYSIDADEIFVIASSGSSGAGYVDSYTNYTKNNVTNGNITELDYTRLSVGSVAYYGFRILNIKREDSSNPITFKTYNATATRAIVFKVK